MPWLLIASPWNPATSSIINLYLSTAGFVTEPGDSPSNTYFDRRIEVPLSGDRSLFSGSDIGGAADATLGEIVCINTDGALDSWADYEWGGRQVELFYSTLPSPTYSDFASVAKHTVEGVIPGDNIRILFRDIQSLIDEPYQITRFAGTGGKEGAAVLKDTRKPRPLGFPIQVEPPVADDINRILVIGDGPVGGAMKLSDRGVELVAGPDYATEAAMMAASFGAAGYVSCYAEGIARLAFPADGPLTADLAGRTRGGNVFAAGSAATTAGRWYVLRAMVTRSAGSVQPTVAGAALGAAVSSTRHIVRNFVATSGLTSIAFVGDGSWSGSVTSIEVFEVLARAADLIEFAITTDTPVTSVSIKAGTVAALNVACPQPLQHWHPGGDGGSVSNVVTELARSVGAWWGANLENKIELGLFSGPAGSADYVFEARDIFELEPQQVAERIKKVELRYARRWREMQESDIAGSVTGDTRTAILAKDEISLATEPSVATAALNSAERKIETLLIRKIDSDAEAARLLALFGPARKALRVVVSFTEGLDVGKTVKITWPRYGLSAGLLFVVLQAERNLGGDATPTHTLTVWR